MSELGWMPIYLMELWTLTHFLIGVMTLKIILINII